MSILVKPPWGQSCLKKNLALTDQDKSKKLIRSKIYHFVPPSLSAILSGHLCRPFRDAIFVGHFVPPSLSAILCRHLCQPFRDAIFVSHFVPPSLSAILCHHLCRPFCAAIFVGYFVTPSLSAILCHHLCRPFRDAIFVGNGAIFELINSNKLYCIQNLPYSRFF